MNLKVIIGHLFFLLLVASHQVTSTPKPGFKPLASVTPFVPHQQQQQQQQNTEQQQQSKESLSTYTKNKYQTEGKDS